MTLITTPETSTIIGCAMRVHTELGPGLLEKAYGECLSEELSRAGLLFESQVALPLSYKGIHIPRAYVADFIVEKSVLVEIKTVDHMLPIHKAQVITYLRLARVTKGLILNFRTHRLKDGIMSVILPQ